MDAYRPTTLQSNQENSFVHFLNNVNMQTLSQFASLRTSLNISPQHAVTSNFFDSALQPLLWWHIKRNMCTIAQDTRFCHTLRRGVLTFSILAFSQTCFEHPFINPFRAYSVNQKWIHSQKRYLSTLRFETSLREWLPIEMSYISSNDGDVIYL